MPWCLGPLGCCAGAWLALGAGAGCVAQRQRVGLGAWLLLCWCCTAGGAAGWMVANDAGNERKRASPWPPHPRVGTVHDGRAFVLYAFTAYDSAMHSTPLHPGLVLRDDVLPALHLSVTQAAQQLGVSRPALSRVLNGHAGISPEMALRLETWLEAVRGRSARAWVTLQSDYDLWRAGQRIQAAPLRVQPIVAMAQRP